MVLSIQNTAPFIPVYRRLLDEYKDAIITHQLRSGDKIDSINEIMRRHQVSRETAKLVLKLLAKEGFIVQKAGKGSFVANLSPMKNSGVLFFRFSPSNIRIFFITFRIRHGPRVVNCILFSTMTTGKKRSAWSGN